MGMLGIRIMGFSASLAHNDTQVTSLLLALKVGQFAKLLNVLVSGCDREVQSEKS